MMPLAEHSSAIFLPTACGGGGGGAVDASSARGQGAEPSCCGSAVAGAQGWGGEGRRTVGCVVGWDGEEGAQDRSVTVKASDRLVTPSDPSTNTMDHPRGLERPIWRDFLFRGT